MTRRHFLACAARTPAGLLLTCAAETQPRWTAQQGFDRFLVPSEACRDLPLTPAAPDHGTFKRGSPLRTGLAETEAAQMPRLELTGRVGGRTCGWIKGATVEWWHADERGRYDMAGFSHRGHAVTDDTGGFRIETTMPGTTAQRAPHLDVRVVVPNRATFQTALYFPDDPRNLRDRFFRPDLLIKVTTPPPRLGGTFDIILNL